MLRLSFQSFVLGCFWFSDSADWMWPCDSCLPGREWWGHGCWGYSWGEPTPEDYQRSARYISFSALYVCACVCECKQAGCRLQLANMVWLQGGESCERKVFHYVGFSVILMPGTLWHLLLITSFWTTCVWLIPGIGCGRNFCQHAARQKVFTEGAPIAGVLSAFAMDTRQVVDLYTSCAFKKVKMK